MDGGGESHPSPANFSHARPLGKTFRLAGSWLSGFRIYFVVVVSASRRHADRRERAFERVACPQHPTSMDSRPGEPGGIDNGGEGLSVVLERREFPGLLPLGTLCALGWFGTLAGHQAETLAQDSRAAAGEYLSGLDYLDVVGRRGARLRSVGSIFGCKCVSFFGRALYLDGCFTNPPTVERFDPDRDAGGCNGFGNQKWTDGLSF